MVAFAHPQPFFLLSLLVITSGTWLQEVAEKAKALTALAKQAAGRPGEAKAWGQPPVRWESETGSESRRRTWVGAPWLLEYNRIQVVTCHLAYLALFLVARRDDELAFQQDIQ